MYKRQAQGHVDGCRAHLPGKARNQITHGRQAVARGQAQLCLLYTSDAADERSSVDLGGRRIIKKKNDHESRDTRRRREKQICRDYAKHRSVEDKGLGRAIREEK